MEIHESLEPIAWLAGRWYTQDGHGQYPNTPDFVYHEDLEFLCLGEPLFNYLSISRDPDDQSVLHQERGFLRIRPFSDEVSLTICHNYGFMSLEEGYVDIEAEVIDLKSINVIKASFSTLPTVKRFRRVLQLLDIDMLEISLFMETDEIPLSLHLNALYSKVRTLDKATSLIDTLYNSVT